MSEYAELVKSLRHVPSTGLSFLHGLDAQKAAAAITALEELVEVWRTKYEDCDEETDYLYKRITALEAQVKDLREAGALLLSVVENAQVSPQEYQLAKRFRAALTSPGLPSQPPAAHPATHSGSNEL